MKFLAEKTLIPISTAVIVIGGAAGWATKISLSQDRYETAIKKSEDRNEYYMSAVNEIRERLIRIETEIKRRKL